MEFCVVCTDYVFHFRHSLGCLVLYEHCLMCRSNNSVCFAFYVSEHGTLSSYLFSDNYKFAICTYDDLFVPIVI